MRYFEFYQRAWHLFFAIFLEDGAPISTFSVRHFLAARTFVTAHIEISQHSYCR